MGDTLARYPFDDEFQGQLLGMMLENFEGICSRNVVSPAYFDNPQDGKIADTILKLYEALGSPPTWQILQQELEKEIADEEAHLFADRLTLAQRRVGALEKKYIGKVAKRFALGQALRIAMAQSVDYLRKDEVERAVDALVKASQVGRYDEEKELKYFESVELRLRKQDQPKGIRTLIPELDTYLQGKGLNYKEIGAILAPPGGGKTMFLCHVAKSAVLQKKFVLFISIDMTAERIATRLDASFSGVKINELYDHVDKVIDKVSGLGRRYGELLLIREYTEKQLSPSGLRSYVQHLVDMGAKPDMIVIDYAGLMRSDFKHERRDQELGSILLNLRRLSKELNVAVWTGVQGRRSAANAELVTLDDIAESFEGVFHANVIISVSRTPEEKQKQKARLFVAKNQAGETNVQVPIYTNFSKGAFYRYT